MSDPDPSLVSSPTDANSRVYRDVVDAAFDVLRRDLKTEMGKRDLARRQSAARVAEGLERLKNVYRKKHGASVGRECVPRKEWSLDDTEKVLDHLARIIHDGRLAKGVFRDEYVLQGLWEAGRFRAVEGLCRDIERLSGAADASERTEELKWLLATWTPRQASDVANLRSSRRSVPEAKRRRPTGEPARSSNVKWRTTSRRALTVRRGR